MTLLWILTGALVVIVGYPLLVLTHELGHAVVVLAYGRSAEAAAGDGEGGMRLKVGRLTVSIGLFELGGHCVYNSNGLSIRQRKAVLMGGPLASGILAAALVVGAFLATESGSVLSWALAACAIVAALQAADAAWPRRRKRGQGRPRSDGAQLRHLRAFEPHYVPPTHDGQRRATCRLSA